MSFLPPEDYEKAKELGREIVRHGATLVTGATTGFPLWAAMGAKELGEISLMFLVHPTLTDEEISKTCNAIDRTLLQASK
jgi:predicted Rossmann-fold nucleotide-binding protein